MAYAKLKVEIKVARLEIQWSVGITEIEADGTDCVRCGDAMYLKAFQMYVHQQGRNKELISRTEICQSCGYDVKNETGL